jgi:hypothetical protein
VSLALVVAALLAGCSSSSGSGTPGGTGGTPDSDAGGTSGPDPSSVAGTWKASALAVAYGSAGSSPTDITTGQTIVIEQTGDSVTFAFTNDDETDGNCSGTLSGSTITSTCSLTQLAGDTSCTASFTRTDVVDASASPMTMKTSYNYTAGGGSACSYSDNVFTVSGTLTLAS